MNFFQSQAKARTQTKRLILLFVLAIFSLVILTNFLLTGFLTYFRLDGNELSITFIKSQFSWHLFFVVGLLVIIFVALGSIYKLLSLRQGGQVVAQSLGGNLVQQQTDNLQYRVLLNVVEEMAIASGTAVPRVYVLKDESAINAFAAGFTKDDAVIGVTQGLLDSLDREELQGVIAHEFSHILNGDMRINLRLMGTLHGIMLIGLLGYYIMRMSGSSRRSKNSGNIVFLGLGLSIIGYGGMFFGNMIKASISRQREYLADASAVQFTRNNLGIADALKKIGAYKPGSKLESAEAKSFSHAFFSDALSNKFSSFLATHPPLEKRIRAIEPNWSGKFLNPNTSNSANLLKNDASEESVIAKLATQQASANQPLNTANKTLLQSVGQISDIQIDQAKLLLNTLSKEIKDIVHSSQGSQAFIYALLLTNSCAKNENALLQKQWRYLQDQLPRALFEVTDTTFKSLSNLDIEFRLPLLEMALPQLKDMPEREYQTLLKIMNSIALMDNKFSIFEWAIVNIVSKYLSREFNYADQMRLKTRSLGSLQEPLEIVISTLLYEFCQQDDKALIFNKANELLSLNTLSLIPENLIDIEKFATAIENLNKLAPQAKEKVLEVCIYTVIQDEHFSPQEYETIRAIADCLDCPMPIRVQ